MPQGINTPLLPTAPRQGQPPVPLSLADALFDSLRSAGLNATQAGALDSLQKLFSAFNMRDVKVQIDSS